MLYFYIHWHGNYDIAICHHMINLPVILCDAILMKLPW